MDDKTGLLEKDFYQTVYKNRWHFICTLSFIVYHFTGWRNDYGIFFS
jgi:hypothetical protein